MGHYSPPLRVAFPSRRVPFSLSLRFAVLTPLCAGCCRLCVSRVPIVTMRFSFLSLLTVALVAAIAIGAATNAVQAQDTATGQHTTSAQYSRGTNEKGEDDAQVQSD